MGDKMKEKYIQAMDAIHRACLFGAGISLVIIVIIIPYGVFWRFVLNSALSWPEPLAVLLMVWLSFLSAVVCYREYLHIGIGILPAILKGKVRDALGIFIEICMLLTNLFMLWYGVKLVRAMWYQWISDFPEIISVGMSYLPIPIGGLITTLFVIERMWTGVWFQEQTIETTAATATE